MGSVSGSGVDSRVARDGRCGLAVDAKVEELVNVLLLLGPEPGRRDEDRSGMLAIEAAAGRDEHDCGCTAPCMALGRVIERPSVTDKDHGLSKAPVHHSNTEIRLPPWSHERETEREGERGREEESERGRSMWRPRQPCIPMWM